MVTVGPELPPHLAAKRKREQEAEYAEQESADPRRTSSSPDSDSASKRQRVLGPSLPPAPLDERPNQGPYEGEDSDSDVELGPALPLASSKINTEIETQRAGQVVADAEAQELVQKPKREEWMLVPPKQDDWSSRVDPTKLRNRKFNTGKGAKAPAQKGNGIDTIWTETPEEKRKRLEDEVMGIKAPAHLEQKSHKAASGEAEARETERRIREYNVSRPLN